MLSELSFCQEGFIFPLKESRELSSIFADHRNFHFHSGIDFRTGEKTGLEVYAAKSGWVYRLFASWWGYGKAVYLKHPNGQLTLYAHLSDFSERLKKIVTDEQLKNKRYRVDIFPQDTIWIEQGELIGYSGETGTGEPHFHFEIRDEKNRPLNPLTSGLSIPDTIAPTFTKIGIRPLDPNSYVDDSTNIMIYPLNFDSTQQAYTLIKIPIVEGRIGIEISAYDQMAEKGSRFGVYKLELFLDSLLVFSSHYETIDFENSWKIELDRDFGLLKKKKGEFYKLYLDYGNDLPLYHSVNRGFLDFSDNGLHQLVILAEDASGNTATARISLRVGRKPILYEMFLGRYQFGNTIKGKIKDNSKVVGDEVDVSPVRDISWKPISRGFCTHYCGKLFFVVLDELGEEPKILRARARDVFGTESDYTYLLHLPDKAQITKDKEKLGHRVSYVFKDSLWVFKISFSQILKNTPEVILMSGEAKVPPLSQKQLDEKSYQFIFPAFEMSDHRARLAIQASDVFGNKIEETKDIDIFMVWETNKSFAESEDRQAKVEIDSGSVYKKVSLLVKKIDMNRIARQRSSFYSFLPSDVPLARNAKITIRCTKGKCRLAKTGLYEFLDSAYKFTGQEIDTVNNSISGEARDLSTYVLLEDKNAPEIREPYPKPGQKINVKEIIISARVSDDLSGIGSDQDIEVYLDREWQIPEYDPEKCILISKPLKVLSPGWHKLVIKARDRMGNTKIIKSRFKII